MAFRDLPESSFPFTAHFIAERTGETVRSITVDGPGVVVVPALADLHGPIAVRIEYANGVVVEGRYQKQPGDV